MGEGMCAQEETDETEELLLLDDWTGESNELETTEESDETEETDDSSSDEYIPFIQVQVLLGNPSRSALSM